MSSAKRKARIRMLVIAAVTVLAVTPFVLSKLHNQHFPEALRGFAVDPKPIGQVSLIDKSGQTLNSQDFKGKWTLVFFGYTNCPDVCPSTLLQLEQLKKSLVKDPAKRDYQFLFITVDPQRDTTQRLKEYVNYFDTDFQAAGGDIAQIKTFEHVFGAFHKYAKKDKNDTHYSVAHSAEVYIVDPEQQYVGKFLPPFDVNKLSQQLTALSNYLQQKGSNA
jgi:protein SCO1/2